jgi:hypothetical protein
MAGSKSKEYTCQKDHGGYWLGICESTLKNVLFQVTYNLFTPLFF